eukprot:GHVQ01001756.1.p1 GENE.GHVQ01001756.1~~GHVQ01001756.1.p1  ORF type:complete len:178 (-),score=8.35 GHVQ01001756.1:102-635(-)
MINYLFTFYSFCHLFISLSSLFVLWNTINKYGFMPDTRNRCLRSSVDDTFSFPIRILTTEGKAQKAVATLKQGVKIPALSEMLINVDLVTSAQPNKEENMRPQRAAKIQALQRIKNQAAADTLRITGEECPLDLPEEVTIVGGGMALYHPDSYYRHPTPLILDRDRTRPMMRSGNRK